MNAGGRIMRHWAERRSTFPTRNVCLKDWLFDGLEGHECSGRIMRNWKKKWEFFMGKRKRKGGKRWLKAENFEDNWLWGWWWRCSEMLMISVWMRNRKLRHVSDSAVYCCVYTFVWNQRKWQKRWYCKSRCLSREGVCGDFVTVWISDMFISKQVK